MLASGLVAVVLTHLPAVVVAAGSTKKGSSLPSIILIVVAGLGVLFVVSRGRRRASAAQAQQTQITVGTTVVTRSGVIGTIVAQTTDEVVLEVAPGVHMRWLAGAISGVRPPADDPQLLDDAADEQHADSSSPADDEHLAD